MEKLKICHVSLAVYPDHRDGAAKYERRLYDELKKRGHDITLLTVKWDTGFNDPNIRTIDVPKKRFFWVPKFTRVYSNFLKKNDFDIIQGNGSRGSLPILFSKKSFLTHIHDVGPFQARFTSIPGLKYLEKKTAKKAWKVMCCAESAKQEISKYMNVPLDKIVNVSSAIDPIYKPMPKEAQELKERLNIKGPIIFYVGRIAFYKGVDYIIEAYYKVRKEIPDLNLIIGGKPTLKMEPVVKEWAKKYPEVRFVGMIPDEDMPKYYSMADLFVTYSFAAEGFGLTPVESLACGTPVICSSMPAFMEVLQDHGIFVEPKKPDLLAQKILEFFKNEELKRNIMENIDKFLKQYTWEEVGNRVENVYKEYLEGIGKI
ncbi:MAG: glycosyltransferase family 4 protein [Promethearchaeota archaeon]